MKKITLNETDLLKIVKRVLNEQKDRQFNEDEIEFLHFIFERELKPPFRKGGKDKHGYREYYNRDGEKIAFLAPTPPRLGITDSPFLYEIGYKVSKVFGFNYLHWDWWDATKPHLKSWMENELNIKLRYIE